MYFDEEQLAALAKQVPAGLQILRLRLRFGLPQTLVLGQRFRIALELVDEMGQAVAPSLARREGLSIRIAPELSSGSPLDRADVELTTREVCVSGSAHQHQQRKSCTWSFDAVFTRKRGSPDASTQSMHDVSEAATEEDCGAEAPLKVILSIQLHRQGTRTCSRSADKSAHEAPEQEQAQGDKTAAWTASSFHCAFQRFCVGSAWLDASALALALHSQPIQLQSATAGAATSPSPATTSSSSSSTNLCRRVFALESLAPEQQQLVKITENYGDTMGAHIWDASILLSYALCYASRDTASTHGMLELGAGCGLFAAVYAALRGVRTRATLPHSHHVVLTERAESIGLLEANLAHNRIGSSHEAPLTVTVAPLVWGTSPPAALAALLNTVSIDAIFAADVLYGWSAHEALLASLDALVAQQERRQQRTPELAVVIAHKHRSRTTSAQLERVVQRAVDLDCGAAESGECAWTHWRVTRTARLGAVDLLELRRARTSSPDASGDDVA